MANVINRKESVGAIYGNNLKYLVESGGNSGFAATLIPTNSTKPYSRDAPYTYNPYPEYNTKAWKRANRGTYRPCHSPFSPIQDVQVFSGHPAMLGESLIGSYAPLDIDSNMCFERETRLGLYIFSSGESTRAVDWGSLQKNCADLNSDRFVQDNATEMHSSEDTRGEVSNSSYKASGKGKTKRLDTIEDEAVLENKVCMECLPSLPN
jgi:hypothetical protein